MSVELLDRMGDDLAIVNAARVSFGKESNKVPFCPHCQAYIDLEQVDERQQIRLTSLYSGVAVPCFVCDTDLELLLSERDRGVISYMARERHGSPFEMVVFKFRVHTTIAVGRDWMRHRIGSYNEISTRYTEMEQEFYIPQASDIRRQVGRPGHYEMVPVEPDVAANAQILMGEAYAEASRAYERLLRLGIARELAMHVLPMGLMTTFIWEVNLRSLFNFLSLRDHPAARREIMYEARAIRELVRSCVPVAFSAWEDCGGLPI